MKRLLIIVVLGVMLLSITSVVFADKDGVTICHRTGAGNFNENTVADDATFGGHISHPGDIIPAPAEGCPDDHDPHH